MKFRQFDFRLFPKIRNRKKKTSKLSRPDYPRDISLDKNCNLYRREFPCFYDNLAAEANGEDHISDYSFCTENATVSDCYDTSHADTFHARSFPRLEFETSSGSSCVCSQRACAPDYVCQHQATDMALAGKCTNSASETPSTIPRTRTRIKTNPWLPSPGSSSSSSLTDQIVTYQASSDRSSSNYKTRPSTLPLFSSRTDCGSITPVNMTERRKHRQRGQEECSQLYHNDLFEEEECTYRKIIKHRRSPLCSLLKEEPDYETDVSSCNSPVNEFLQCVKYEIDFAYEHTADDLLENSTFPRDDSFTSVLNLHADIPDIEVENERDKEYHMKSEVEIDMAFDDSNNNMQESIDTGYGSVSRDSDFLSSDEEFGQKCDVTSDRKSATAHYKVTEEMTNKKLEPVNYYDHSTTRDLDANSCNPTNETDGIDYIANDETSDLEWDDEPSTKTLILEFAAVANLAVANKSSGIPEVKEMDGCITKGEITFQSPFKRYGSVKYRKLPKDGNKCACHRRSRSLADIELSLDEKVSLLREEKSFVERKIHEAKLEEKVRQHQLKIFRLLSGDKKHQLILNTLHDLKSRLENQSVRLQASYSTVISLQNMF